jgi:uncharacterized protein involved in exopolysaccharide biosynthesis
MPTNAAGGLDHVARQPKQNGLIEKAPTLRRRRQYTDGPREETSLLGFVNILLLHRGLIAVCALVGGVILGVSAFDSPRWYMAYASFTVRGAKAPSQLSAVATQLGLTLGSLDENQSLSFYGDLVTTGAILGPVSRTLYTDSLRGGGEKPLAAYFGIHEKNPGVARSQALDELRSRVAATTTPRTGIINVRVLAEQPPLARQILQNILTELDAYNLATRRNRAVAERDFVERRVAEANAALLQAERHLSSFLQMNRAYSSSPVLQMEFDRLERAVRMRQQIYTAMARSLEQAKIEEVRDLPTVLVIDQPEAALEPQRPPVIRRTLLGLIAGIFVGIVLAFLRERAAETREAGTSAYTEYSALKRKALGDLARPWAPVGRLLKGQTRA